MKIETYLMLEALAARDHAAALNVLISHYKLPLDAKTLFIDEFYGSDHGLEVSIRDGYREYYWNEATGFNSVKVKRKYNLLVRVWSRFLHNS